MGLHSDFNWHQSYVACSLQPMVNIERAVEAKRRHSFLLSS